MGRENYALMPPAQGGDEDSIRLLLSKNPVCSFSCHKCQVHGFSIPSAMIRVEFHIVLFAFDNAALAKAGLSYLCYYSWRTSRLLFQFNSIYFITKIEYKNNNIKLQSIKCQVTKFLFFFFIFTKFLNTIKSFYSMF